MGTGILLVHGYTGSTGDLKPLEDRLAAVSGSNRVVNLSLPFVGGGPVSGFDAGIFKGRVAEAADALADTCERLAVFAHSTGGSLVLACLAGGAIRPDLLILAGVPGIVDKGYIKRWENHAPAAPSPGFTDVCKMISLINSSGKRVYDNECPVILINGGDDDLVLPETAVEWENRFKGGCRRMELPEAGHHFPSDSRMADLTADIIIRAVRDIAAAQIPFTAAPPEIDPVADPEISAFLEASPLSAPHLARCPSGRRLAGKKVRLPAAVGWEPVLANIEITTRCNLSCRFCMRTRTIRRRKERPGDMPPELFARILERLPHASRITFVGLGEPLLHPQIIDFIKMVKARGKRASLVTNGHVLDSEMSVDLIRAGLDAIVFSIDAPDQAGADRLRAGSDVDGMVANIKAFTAMEKNAGRRLSKAVFSALSLDSLDTLPLQMGLIADLGVDVLMVSDLNFSHNAGHALLNNIDTAGKNKLRDSLKHAFGRQLPVLSVYGLEEFGLRRRYQRFLALPPSKIYTRPREHTHCATLWQTLPVNVKGEVYLCDCRPGEIAGNLLTDPFDRIWNGSLFQRHRKKMTGGGAPEICRHCPRF